VLGWLVGDGWLRFGDGDRRVGFTFGPDDASMLVRIKTSTDRWYGRAVAAVPRKGGVVHLSYHGKYFVDFFRQLGVSADGAAQKVVPETLFTAPRSAVVGFLQGLFTADGTVRANKKANSEWVALTSKSKPLLQGVQLLLLNLGIKTSIFDRSRAARPDCFSYRAINGELRTYASDGVLYELAICGRSRETFRREVGFLNQKQRALEAVRFGRFYREKLTDTVVSREPGGARPVYDLTEPQTRSMIVNGIVVHNCGEQPLLPMEACNLGSIDVSKLARRDEGGAWSLDWQRLEQVVRSSVRFLDDVIECNPYPLPAIDSMVKSNRRIGIGVMGWADLLFRLGIPYDSDEALVLGDRLMATLQVTGHDESARLAEERGAFPNWQRSIYRDAAPRRNATVTTVAPTGTISIIAGCSSGIEPAFAISYTHHVGERVLPFVNRVFEEVARERGFWSEELMAEVARRGGVRGLAAVPEDVQRVFVTAHEVPYEWHVRHQAAFQKWTDNGVSKTINLPHEATLEDVRRAYLLAWELGCLGITVFREGSKPGVLRVGAAGSQSNGAGARPLDGVSAVPGETDALAVTPRAAGAAPAPLASSSRGGVLEPRPASLHGTTHRVQTPLGTAYVVVNEDRDGEPFEVFVSVGKAGTDTMAVAEAIGRLVSLALRMPSSVSPRARLAEIVEQLSGIGGARPLGFGNERVLSLPDGIAQALARHLGSAVVRRAGDICPECGAAALVREEGCAKCHACGFSEC
jgi:ribonucleoside-diphosphate reductase alpha chain